VSDTPETPENEEESFKPIAEYTGPTVSIIDEMKTSYLDYAMSVIVSRAIPDLRDGLKPVHRRIIYSMYEKGITFDKSYRKSAKSVGDVMGSYHPHGDSAIYESLVRMAQDFSMSLPLVDGQGNFGSMDGDNAAAMRYTESRLAKVAQFMTDDLAKDTVDFIDNYDGKEREPTVLPTRFPNMLVNGAGGIAVGMATNIPPHNLGEVIDATLALIDNPDMSVEDLIEIVPGPDFPTGGIMLGRSGARKAYLEGRGSVIMRAKTRVEEIRKDRYAIVIDEVPYQVNKANMIDKIAEAARDKKIEGIAHVQDESDRNGVRVVVELKRDATAEVVLNQLFRFTPMQQNFACNMLALNGGKPETLTLHNFLSYFIDFREDVVARRTAFELRKARDRSHILCGLAVAVTNIDEIVQTIRSSADAATARTRLMERRWPAESILDYIKLIDDPTHTANEDGTYNLSETQARAILDLRLQRLTQIGVKEVTDELQELAGKIKEYLAILGSRDRIMQIIRDELNEVREGYAVPRRTEIVDWSGDMEDEDLIEKEDMVVTVTSGGYIKRTALTDFRAQRRGGKGVGSMATKEEDVVTTLFVANTHTQLLFFTTDGMVYKLKTWRLPLGSRTAKGKAIVNILPIPTADFTNVKSNGKIAMKFEGEHENTTLINARIASNDDDVMLVTDSGRAIRFPATDVRVFNSRGSVGVRGIKLQGDDKVVSMSIIRHFVAEADERSAYLKMRRAMAGLADDAEMDDEDAPAGEITQERYAEMSAAENLILTITAQGSGKLSSSHDYPVRGRGGMGVAAMDKAMRGGALVTSFPVEMEDQIMLVTSTGQSIRVPVEGISFRSRGAGGVKVFDTGKGETVVSVAWIADQGDEEGTETAE